MPRETTPDARGEAPIPMSGRLDLIIAGGELIDPATGRQGRFDLGIRGGRIAVVEPELPSQSAARVLDAAGQLVVPGLVDLHTHVYEGGTFWGIDPDLVAWRTGVTTWVDAGSAGAYNLGGLRRSAREALVRVRAFVNISAIGLVAENGEARDLSICDPRLCATVAGQNADLVVGVKCRIDSSTVGRNGIEPLRLARKAARDAGVPLMVHIGKGPPLLEDVLGHLGPGDILTHCASPHSMRLIDNRGRPKDVVREAVSNGVVLDIGHGSGSFSFEVAEALITHGCAPHVISSDLHSLSVHGPAHDLPTCLSKLLGLGMPLRDVIEAATTAPAKVIGLDAEVGSLAVGRTADIAVFSVSKGRFVLRDALEAPREVGCLLSHVLTLRAGVPLPQREPASSPPWVPTF
jgi:dihydroorotase